MLHAFTGKDGADLRGELVEGPAGTFHGITEAGGEFNLGTIFRISSTGEFKTVASFNVPDGYSPMGRMIRMTDGSFLGNNGGRRTSGLNRNDFSTGRGRNLAPFPRLYELFARRWTPFPDARKRWATI